MSSEGIQIANPRGNNRDLVVYFDGRDGKRKKFKNLRPGEAIRCDKKRITVEEVDRPPRLLLTENGFERDRSAPRF